MFSHQKRDYLFSAEEVMVAAELQYDALHRNSQEGKTFVTLKLTGTGCDFYNISYAFAVSEEGQSQLESFQVSDQAVKLHDKKLYAQPLEAEPNIIRTKEKVLMHTKQGGREDRDKMDTDIVLTRVRSKPYQHFLSAVGSVAAGEGRVALWLPHREPTGKPCYSGRTQALSQRTQG